MITLHCSINDGQLKLEESIISKAMLENNKCYLLDCGAELFVWVGRVTQVEDRKAASKAAEVYKLHSYILSFLTRVFPDRSFLQEFIISQNRPKTTRITQVIQGFETRSFKSNFESWPAGTGSGTSSGEDGRGKVAGIGWFFTISVNFISFIGSNILSFRVGSSAKATGS